MLAGLSVPLMVSLGFVGLGVVAWRRDTRWQSPCYLGLALLWMGQPWLMSVDLLSRVTLLLIVELLAVKVYRQGDTHAAKVIALVGVGMFLLPFIVRGLPSLQR